MFDFAWSEIALIAVVALIAIGPKDMPAAIRGVTNMIKKARRMAAEFQTHVDEMMREANLDEVRSQFNEIRNFDVKGEIERAVDADGSLRSTFASNPLEPAAAAATTAAKQDTVSSDLQFDALPVTTAATTDAAAEEASPAEIALEPATDPALPQTPAFIPPNALPPPGTCTRPAQQTGTDPEPPAFIPPEAVLQRRLRPSV
jgi:sec-independent protein translocase protein TatB